MPKLTVLDMVQDILSDLDSDNVNSINDTVESLQVAQIVKTTYFDIISRRKWPHLYQTIDLDSSVDISKPTHLKLPDNVSEIDFFNYDKAVAGGRSKYSAVTYMTPEEFITYTNQRNTDNSNVTTVTDFSGVKFHILNDAAPSYWTSFDEEYMVCDSYNSAVDVILQNSKTQCHGYVEPTFNMADNFVPDLPSEAFSFLLAEAKSVSFVTLKQVANEKAEQQATRQERFLSRSAWKAKGGIKYPNYGRK